MLPVVRKGLPLKVDKLGFYKRRARRIMPPYYAALALSILLLPQLGQVASYRAMLNHDMELSILMHLLMLQNWSVQFFYGLDGPLWSVAAECQIYLLFPFLIYLLQRAGMLPTMLLVFVVANGIFWLTHPVGPADYLFIFVLGMLGASIANRGGKSEWLEWAAAGSLISLGLISRLKLHASPRYMAVDLCIGMIIASVMASCCLRKHSVIRDFLSLRILRWVGRFSYSIYLTHAIVQWLLFSFITPQSRSSAIVRFSLMAGDMCCALAVAYVFYLLVERPCLSPSARNPRIAERLPVQSTKVSHE